MTWGVPVSVGIGATHTLAKSASHGAKHSPALGHVADLDTYRPGQVDAILEATPVADLWVFAFTSWWVAPVHQVSLAGRRPADARPLLPRPSPGSFGGSSGSRV